MMSSNSVKDLVSTSSETAFQTSLGQVLLKLFDKVLWVIEKSAQWSLPDQESNSKENGKTFGKIVLVRPLPWILFLPSLIFLRMVRASINVSARIFGHPRVEPYDVVRSVQRCRRRLRAVKYVALKNIRIKKANKKDDYDRAMTFKEASKSLAKSIRLTLSTLSCLDSGFRASPSPPPTKIRVSNIFDSVSSLNENGSAKLDQVTPSPDHKRKFSELNVSSTSDSESDEDDNLLAKIERLANESYTDDSYVPSEDIESDDSEENLSISSSEMNEFLMDKLQLDEEFKIQKEKTKKDDINKKERVKIEILGVNDSPSAVSKSETERQDSANFLANEKSNSIKANGIVSENEVDVQAKDEMKNGEVPENENKTLGTE